jgi:hypothetical protein
MPKGYRNDGTKLIPPNKRGYKFSKEHNQKIRKFLTGRKRPEMCGANNPLWKGGISPLNIGIRTTIEYRQWRSDVFTRDNFTCQKCWERGGELEILNYIKRK